MCFKYKIGFSLAGIILVFFSVSSVQASVTDQLAELYKKIEELTQKEKEYKSNIEKKQKEATSLSREIGILGDQIRRLQISIALTEKEIEATGLEIQNVRRDIFTAEEKLEGKKRSMAGLIKQINETDNRTLTTILLSSGNLSDFFGNLEYINSLSTNVLRTLADIRKFKALLESREQVLSDKKTKAETLERQYKSRNSALDGTKNEKDRLLAVTKGKEAEYQRMLEEVEREKAKFFAELKELEQNARNEGIFIVSIKADVVPPPGIKLFLWPQDDFRLTQGYGMTAYARRGAYGGAPHNGVDLASSEGSFVKAIGEGIVVAKGYNDGFGNWVAVKHQNNLVSVYAHFRSPAFVNVDDLIKQGDTLGLEGSTGNSTGPHLHLSLYKEFFTYLNPKRNNQVYFNYFDGSLNPLDYL